MLNFINFSNKFLNDKVDGYGQKFSNSNSSILAFRSGAGDVEKYMSHNNFEYLLLNDEIKIPNVYSKNNLKNSHWEGIPIKNFNNIVFIGQFIGLRVPLSNLNFEENFYSTTLLEKIFENSIEDYNFFGRSIRNNLISLIRKIDKKINIYFVPEPLFFDRMWIELCNCNNLSIRSKCFEIYNDVIKSYAKKLNIKILLQNKNTIDTKTISTKKEYFNNDAPDGFHCNSKFWEIYFKRLNLEIDLGLL